MIDLYAKTIISGQQSTYRHLTTHVSPLLADSGLSTVGQGIKVGLSAVEDVCRYVRPDAITARGVGVLPHGPGGRAVGQRGLGNRPVVRKLQLYWANAVVDPMHWSRNDFWV